MSIPFIEDNDQTQARHEHLERLRRLVGLVLATAALLGALGVAAPAAAETAQQCHTTLNQYRAKAGLDKASSSSIPALAVATTLARRSGLALRRCPGGRLRGRRLTRGRRRGWRLLRGENAAEK